MTDKFPKPVSSPSVPQTFDGEIYQAVGKYARSAVLFAFEQMDGPQGLAKWAQDNKDEFYTKLFPKIIARESEVTHHRSVDQLMDVIDGDFEVEGVEEAVYTEPEAHIPQSGVVAVEPVAHNWNAGEYDFDNDVILAEAVDAVDEEFDAFDPRDLVEFEE